MNVINLINLYGYTQVFQSRRARFVSVALLIGPLLACVPPHDEATNVLHEHSTQVELDLVEKHEGRALMDVALGQSSHIVAEQKMSIGLPKEALPYVGRYAVKISCEDGFVYCDEGEADLIISLLPNGFAHRMIVYLGSITFASNRQYRQDRWSYDPYVHQITLHRANGVEFFYDIDKENNIVMDLEEIANATEINRQYFAEGNPFPLQAYMLKKM